MSLPYIPYFQTTRYRVQTMIELANIKPGEKAADLGSGDGRIVIELVKAGAEVVGYELDQSRIELSEENIKKAFMNCHPESSERPFKDSSALPQNDIIKPLILQKDFWEEDLSHYEIITVYPMPDVMEILEKKLLGELQPGARVLLNYYAFPNWQYETTKDHIYLYRT